MTRFHCGKTRGSGVLGEEPFFNNVPNKFGRSAKIELCENPGSIGVNSLNTDGESFGNCADLLAGADEAEDFEFTAGKKFVSCPRIASCCHGIGELSCNGRPNIAASAGYQA